VCGGGVCVFVCVLLLLLLCVCVCVRERERERERESCTPAACTHACIHPTINLCVCSYGWTHVDVHVTYIRTHNILSIRCVYNGTQTRTYTYTYTNVCAPHVLCVCLSVGLCRSVYVSAGPGTFATRTVQGRSQKGAPSSPGTHTDSACACECSCACACMCVCPTGLSVAIFTKNVLGH
jgi:hypothetical protein